MIEHNIHEHHEQAAQHYEHAAKRHRVAAKHHKARNHEKAAHQGSAMPNLSSLYAKQYFRRILSWKTMP